jgi:hypothetical protein
VARGADKVRITPSWRTRLAFYVAGTREIRHRGRCRPQGAQVIVGVTCQTGALSGERGQMTSNDITCAAGGSLTASSAGVSVEDPVARPDTAVPRSPGWRVETAAPGWLALRCQLSGQVLAVSGQDDTLLILTAAPQGTRHHWRIIPYPERRSVVIISRATGLVRTAGSSDAGRPARVALTAYHGAAAQHWSFIDHRGGTDATQRES